MNIFVNHIVSVDPALLDFLKKGPDSLRLAMIEQKLDILIAQGATMTSIMQRLQDDVSKQKTVIDSAITLIGGLAQQIRDSQNDPVALSALADSLEQQDAGLAAAVLQNTPAQATEPAAGTGAASTTGNNPTPGV